MKSNKLPDQAYLHEILCYDEKTGVFTWRKNKGRRGRAGNVVGNDVGFGYKQFRIDGVFYRLHRVAWKYVYGVDPVGYIDHIDGDTTNNTISNLRDVTPAQSSFNKGLSKRNKSGVTGVYWSERYAKWMVRGRVKRKLMSFGLYEKFDDAVLARKKFEIQYFGEYRRGA